MQLGQLEALVEGVPNSTLQQGLVGLGHDMSAPLQDILEQKLRSYSTLSYATICFYEGRLGEVGQVSH